MTNKDDMNARAQALAAQLEQMRTDMYKLVDNAILNIARTCAGMSPEMFEEVITSVFHPLESAAATAAASRPAATKKRPGRKAIWSRSSDKALRTAYANRRKKGQDIEPELEAELKQSIGDSAELNLDFAKLEYLSSAGLRGLLAAQKIMNKQGKMVIRNVNDVISEVFEVTGFSDILTIE